MDRCRAPGLLWTLGLLLLGACATTATSRLSYGDGAKTAYAAALDQFYRDDCLTAEPAMAAVRRKYPYSRFAALAELRQADCMSKDGKYAEAIQAYRQFVRYRPSHVEVPYAHFMIASCHFEQIPSDWLLAPPAYEREQHYTQETLRLVRRFVLDYPQDPLVGRAQRMAKQALGQLAAHELYVATFYLDRDHPLAAVGRLRTLLRSYPGSGHEPEALLLLGQTYLELQDRKNAQLAFKQLVDQFPKSSYAAEARSHVN